MFHIKVPSEGLLSPTLSNTLSHSFPLSFTFFPMILYFQTVVKIRFGRRDAGGEREQRRRPPGQAEEEVPQPVDPQDQQHRAGSLWPAERHAGGTGDDSLFYTVIMHKNTRGLVYKTDFKPVK